MSAVLIFMAFIPLAMNETRVNVCFYLFELIKGFNSPPVCACMALKNLLLPSLFSEKRSRYSLARFTPDVLGRLYLRRKVLVHKSSRVCV